MNNGKWLTQATKKLEKAGISTARLDSLVLLEDVTGKDRSWLLAHPEFTVKGSTLYKLNEWIENRAQHEPLSYIRGKSEFYGREFKISKDTLEPRPETETMIDILKKLISNLQKSNLLENSSLSDEQNTDFGLGSKFRVVDVGTGSGCLGITAKLELPRAEVLATDISPACIKVARQNAKNLEADVKFYQGDLLQPFYSLKPITHNLILLCNLPYVPDGHTINPAAMFEPQTAIFGGLDGLDLYRRMFKQITETKQKPDYIFTESLPFQHEQLVKIARDCGYEQSLIEDFIQCFQFSENTA